MADAPSAKPGSIIQSEPEMRPGIASLYGTAEGRGIVTDPKAIGEALAGWIVTNVSPSGHKTVDDLGEASILADRCASQLAGQDIGRAEMEDQVGNLTEHMRRALNIAQAAAEVAGRDDHPSDGPAT